MKAILRQISITPKKANLIAELVRNKTAMDAITILKFTPKKAAKILKKLISSAVANATNNLKQDKESLFIKEIIVTKGTVYKRGVPVSRGRVHPILKRTSHITVKLGQILSETEVAPKKEPPETKVIKPKKSSTKK